MEETKESLKEQIETLKQDYEDFSYIVSHDIKANLRAISFLTEWIEDDLRNEAYSEINSNFDILKARVQKMNKMMESLTVFSRIERYHLEKTEIELFSILNEIKNILESEYKNLEVIFDVNNIKFITYSYKIKYVINEIIKNSAIHNSDQNIIVTIDIVNNFDSIELTIKDNGKGVNLKHEELAKLFNMFYTIEPKEKTEFAGAGLAICKKIIKLIKGEIYIENNKPAGLTVKIKWIKE